MLLIFQCSHLWPLSPCIWLWVTKSLTVQRDYREVKLLSHVWLFATPWTGATRLLRPWNFSGRSTGVGCHLFLQGIFLTQGTNLGLPHCWQMLYHLSHQGSPDYREGTSQNFFFGSLPKNRYSFNNWLNQKTNIWTNNFSFVKVFLNVM